MPLYKNFQNPIIVLYWGFGLQDSLYHYGQLSNKHEMK